MSDSPILSAFIYVVVLMAILFIVWIRYFVAMKDQAVRDYKHSAKYYRPYVTDPTEDNVPGFNDVLGLLKNEGYTYDPVVKQFIDRHGSLFSEDLIYRPIRGAFYSHVMNVNVPIRTRNKALSRAVRYTGPVAIYRIKKHLAKE